MNVLDRSMYCWKPLKCRVAFIHLLVQPRPYDLQISVFNPLAELPNFMGRKDSVAGVLTGESAQRFDSNGNKAIQPNKLTVSPVGSGDKVWRVLPEEVIDKSAEG
jgi:hypothetical protein